MPLGNRPYDIRGRDVRAQLVTVLRERAEAGRPIPWGRWLAVRIGISRPQICRHLKRLEREGVWRPERRNGRIFVASIVGGIGT